MKSKRSLELVTSRSLGYKTSPEKFLWIPSSDSIWNGFWVIPKITSADLCKPIHDIITDSTFWRLTSLYFLHSFLQLLPRRYFLLTFSCYELRPHFKVCIWKHYKSEKRKIEHSNTRQYLSYKYAISNRLSDWNGIRTHNH